MLVGYSRIRQNNIAEEVSGVNDLVDGVIMPGFMVPPYYEISTVEYLIPAASFVISVSMQDVLSGAPCLPRSSHPSSSR